MNKMFAVMKSLAIIINNKYNYNIIIAKKI